MSKESFQKFHNGFVNLINKYWIKFILTILLVIGVIIYMDRLIDHKISDVIPATIENTIGESNEKHHQKLVESQEVYIYVKQRLRSIIRETGCEYIYLVEYHNGSENIATAFPFRKFDVTMDLCKEGVPYIDSSPLKDEHVSKYDIFDNAEYTKQQLAYCDRETFKKVDPKLYHMMAHNQNIQWIYTYNLYYKGQLLGAILILSYDELNLKKLVNCLHEVEDIFNGDNQQIAQYIE